MKKYLIITFICLLILNFGYIEARDTLKSVNFIPGKSMSIFNIGDSVTTVKQKIQKILPGSKITISERFISTEYKKGVMLFLAQIEEGTAIELHWMDPKATLINGKKSIRLYKTGVEELKRLFPGGKLLTMTDVGGGPSKFYSFDNEGMGFSLVPSIKIPGCKSNTQNLKCYVVEDVLVYIPSK